MGMDECVLFPTLAKVAVTKLNRFYALYAGGENLNTSVYGRREEGPRVAMTPITFHSEITVGIAAESLTRSENLVKSNLE
jgi:hypothetical protein